MLTSELQQRYLERIGVFEPVTRDLDGLNILHHAHVTSVPFENLDIHLGQTIELAEQALIDKIIHRNRGGFCYELNHLFYLLLRSLDFTVVMLGGRVWNAGEPGRPLAHLLLAVDVSSNGDAPSWVIADVGFGKSFREVLPLDGEVCNEGAFYRVAATEDIYQVQQTEQPPQWTTLYDFTFDECRIEDFHSMCQFQQTSPESVFTQQALCSIVTENGRKTIAGSSFIETDGSGRTERSIDDAESLHALLKQHFGVILPEPLSANRILSNSTGHSLFF